ncbi:hypothetical protein HWV62_40705 [Athelia sp. TMB]|nr:hypothetical protein HWV62_40705 [Athelia sp. TMB]
MATDADQPHALDDPTPAPTPPQIGLARPGGASGSWGEAPGGGTGVSVRRGLHQFGRLARETSRASEKETDAGRGRSVGREGEEDGDEKIEEVEETPRANASHPGEEGTFGESTPHPETLQEAEAEEEKEGEDGGFDLRAWIESRSAAEDARGIARKKLGLAWRALGVRAPADGATLFIKTLPRAVLGTFGPDLYYILRGLLGGVLPRSGGGGEGGGRTKAILRGHAGVLRPGEMLLVLGRPGSGCSTFLRALAASLPAGLALAPGSSVSYGGLSGDEIRRKLRGEVVYSGEDDLHYAHLTVKQTLRFALKNKVPRGAQRLMGEGRTDFVEKAVDVLLNMFGIQHVGDTICVPFTPPDERSPALTECSVRGVSGGERKRVSIAEALVTRASLVAWDNSTRGLDASTALDYARSLRLLTSLQRTSATVATLYQVSETIYAVFDRVLLMDAGRCVYYGPTAGARAYFERLGFAGGARATTADFLTGLTDPHEVQFRPGCEGSAPRTPEAREAAWLASPEYAQLQEEMSAWDAEVAASGAADALALKSSVRAEKNKGVRAGSNYTVPFLVQVRACAVRQLQVKWGQREDIFVKLFTIVSIALLISSLFHGEGTGTAGAYSRGGIMLFAGLFNGWLQLSEAIEAVAGRVVIEKHKTFGFHRPSAVVIARALTDVPLLVVQCFLSSVIIYWMADLRRDAGAFFVFYLYTFLSAYNLTALYRMLSAFSPGFNEAIRFSVLALNVIVVFIGYVIHRPQMNWMKFLSYINGISYVFEGFMVNEFTYAIPCAAASIVPFGAPAPSGTAYQTCAFPGNTPGSLSVPSASYLATAFGYSHSHLWRNVGVVIAFTVLYLVPTIVAAELLPFAGGGAGFTIFARTKNAKRAAKLAKAQAAHPDPEAKADLALSPSRSASERTVGAREDEKPRAVDLDARPVFTWRDVHYAVAGKDLLNGIDGYVRPGQLTALMGISGAGKTTLLTTLSQRQTTGVVRGEMRVDGRPLGPGFQKGTGFVQQQDNHLPTQTVREAVAFSALLRQPREVPHADKMASVDSILRLLELEDLQDALIGVPGAGLGVERRKRVTIAVELAAQPDVLLFLDEPTSGLDSAGAASIVRLLRKLADGGQAVLCTIHQPSALLFEAFDNVLLIGLGGRTAYFGPIGEKAGRDSEVVRAWFEAHGAPPCAPDANVAEYILELTAGDRSGRMNWGARWAGSMAAARVRAEIAEMEEARAKRPAVEDVRASREFSASLGTQIRLTTVRLFVDLWRDAAYPYGVLFSNIIVGLVLGLAFQHLGYGIADFQNRVFIAFIVITNFPAVVNAIIAKFFMVRSLFENREGPSKAYSWVALITSFILTSLPIGVASAVIYFLPSFFIPYYARSTPVAGAILFSFALASAAPTPTTAANILPFLLSIMAIVNGIIVPHAEMTNPWRDFVYWVNPLTYYVGGFLGATLHGLEVVCTPTDLAVFDPPPGQTCGAYAGAWAAQSGGYLVDAAATAGCGYCAYSSGDQYLTTLDIRYEDRWRDFGIFLAYVVFNAFLAYVRALSLFLLLGDDADLDGQFCYYMFRVRQVSVWGSLRARFRRAPSADAN